MNVNIELDEKDLRKLVLEKLSEISNLSLTEQDVTIEVKSKQNYRAEWEPASFRARINKAETAKRLAAFYVAEYKKIKPEEIIPIWLEQVGDGLHSLKKELSPSELNHFDAYCKTKWPTLDW